MFRLLKLTSSSFNDLCQQHSATHNINLQKEPGHFCSYIFYHKQIKNPTKPNEKTPPNKRKQNRCRHKPQHTQYYFYHYHFATVAKPTAINNYRRLKHFIKVNSLMPAKIFYLKNITNEKYNNDCSAYTALRSKL